jgi:hypothetical protein
VLGCHLGFLIQPFEGLDVFIILRPKSDYVIQPFLVSGLDVFIILRPKD